MNRQMITVAAIATFLFTTTAQAGAPAVTCRAGKLGTAGKYGACRLSAESKAVKAGTTADYSKCASKFSSKWQSTETKAAGACPTSADETAIGQRIIDHADAIATLLSGGTVYDCPTDLATCNTALAACTSSCVASVRPPLSTGQTTCYDTAGAVLACAGSKQDGELMKGAPHNFTDNGNGTVTDNVTGLMWEKLSRDGTIHDRGTFYTWTDAFAKVASLNAVSFGGHNDWRVPNLYEMETLRNLGALHPATFSAFHNACIASCTITTCSCSSPGTHWSSSAFLDNPASAWVVDFHDGTVHGLGKENVASLRAVRGGL